MSKVKNPLIPSWASLSPGTNVMFDREREQRWVKKIEAEWARKKRGRNDAKQKAKLRAEQNQRNSRIAEENAQIARRNLNMSKADIITIAKSIVAKGPGSQPGYTSRDFYLEMTKQAAANRTAGQTEAQAFAKFAGTEDGRLLMAAMRKAEQVSCEPDDDDDDDDMAERSDDAGYAKLAEIARDLMTKDPALSFSGAFTAAYNQRPDLAEISKSHSRQRVLKAYSE